MAKITTTGLDIAKNVFHVVCCDERGQVMRKRMLKRRQVLAYFAQLEPCLIGMEACASAHYWARQLEALGYEVKLIPAQYVKAYVRGNKNDYNDALAISEAVTRPQGLAPRQHSSGGKDTLLGISKRGDRYLRSLLVHGARAVVSRAAKKDDRLSRWINKIWAARGVNKATVALANKMARMGWVILAHKTVYQAA